MEIQEKDHALNNFLTEMVFSHLNKTGVFINGPIVVASNPNCNLRVICLHTDDTEVTPQLVSTIVAPRYELRQVEYLNDDVDAEFGNQRLSFQLDVVHPSIRITKDQYRWIS